MRDAPLDRRRLLLSGACTLGSLGLFSSRALAGSIRPREEDEDAAVLVLVQLSGGNDGLSMVVPHGDDAYHTARRATRIAPEEVLRLDDYRGLHPELGRLHALVGEGRLAIVEGVGYPEPNRSHFKSFEIWHTASHAGRSSGEGWVGKLCEAAFGDEALANRVVHVGPRVPYSLHSTTHPPASFTAPDGYRWVKNEETDAGLGWEAKAQEGGGILARLRTKMLEARDSSAAIRAALARYRTPVEYPAEEFGNALRSAAALIEGRVGARIVSVELGGFDTHNDQSTRHRRLMVLLDEALGAFLADLERTEAGRRAVVLAFSEFGRRFEENGSRGTDHGTAGPMLVAGAGVRGGLHGAHPSLVELDQGDLIHTTDFRSVYAAAIDRVFGIDSTRVLGGRYPRLDLFA